MKLILFLVAALASLSAFANDDLAHMSHQIDLLISQNADQLTLQQTAQVYELFSRIQQTVGKPLPNLPTPPMPPTPPTPPPFISCDNDDPQAMQTAFAAVKNFAYQANGLNMSMNDAGNFALQWTHRYSCSASSGYVKDGVNIYQMAYEASGYNLSGPDANAYVKDALERRCQSGLDFAQLVQPYYNFAYSASGMNLSGPDANSYARKQMEAKYFSCGRIHR